MKDNQQTEIVLITGASSGIGQATARLLAQKGYKVYGTSRNAMNGHSEPFEFLVMDVKNVQSIQLAVDQLLEKEGRIDILINNAGVGITGPVEETPLDAMRDTFETNFYGPLAVIQAVLPAMRQQQNGLIINVTSIAGAMGLPFRAAYSATKSALDIISEGLRMEIAQQGIQLCTLAPGDVATNIAASRYHAPLVKGSPYEMSYGATLHQMNEGVNAGVAPAVIAQKIVDIIQQKAPKVHYYAGAFMERLSLVLKRFLPDKMFEQLLKNHYKL
ncbi:MAG: short-chain dehydrogenase/reductase [Flavobacterium sp. BFFFF2]|nr:MAG: short-chain dehydrogenase/reductase [Flavobacterium sp. BFFFF2]